MNYEAHITCTLKDSQKVQTMLPIYKGWKYSAIEGDPLLGPDLHCYLTSHSTNYLRLYRSMKVLEDDLFGMGVQILRMKIELIIYDTKTGEGL